MEQIYTKYLNIQKFITIYRGFELVDDEFLSYDDFKSKMQITGYIKHSFVQQSQKGGSNLDIYLFSYESPHIKKAYMFRKILDKYKDAKTIFLFTKDPLSVYIKKSIKSYPSLTIEKFLYKHFIMEICNGPLCGKHTILTTEEARMVCFELMQHGHKLPAISVNDPQNIWIGGKINDIIKIESKSEISGSRVNYRIVTPISGKVEQTEISITKKVKPLTKEKVVQTPAEESKEVPAENEPGLEDYGDFADFDESDAESVVEADAESDEAE